MQRAACACETAAPVQSSAAPTEAPACSHLCRHFSFREVKIQEPITVFVISGPKYSFEVGERKGKDRIG